MSQKSQTNESARRIKQEVVGEVISDKMQKTISVQTFTRVRHPKYGKFLKKTSIFKAHDEKNEAKVGDKVLITSARPLSKTKRWMLKSIIEKAEQGLDGVNI